MSPDIIQKVELAGGKNSCHRKPPTLLHGPLGKLTLAHHPCIRELCTLWDAPADQCLDITNSRMLVAIASHLGVILDHLPPELP